MSNRVVVLTLLAVVGAPALAGAAGPPPVKPAEVVTVGTAPATFSAADRAKLAEVVRRFAAESARPRVWHPGAAELMVKPVDVSTRTPATGARDRKKPMPTAPEKAGRP